MLFEDVCVAGELFMLISFITKPADFVKCERLQGSVQNSMNKA